MSVSRSSCATPMALCLGEEPAGLDLQTLKKRKAAIGEWPEASEAELTPFLKMMISRNARGRALVKTVGRLNLQHLSRANDVQIKAVTSLVWEIKGLYYALISGKASDVLGDLGGKDAVVIGRSILVGKPMAALLLGANCTVTMAHSRTRDLPDLVRRADIVVAAVGRPEMVKGDWIKPGAVVIDVGINRLPTEAGATKGRLVGDVDYASAAAVAGAITPVPGGVGPMTIACLLRNTLVAAHRRAGLADPEGF